MANQNSKSSRNHIRLNKRLIFSWWGLAIFIVAVGSALIALDGMNAKYPLPLDVRAIIHTNQAFAGWKIEEFSTSMLDDKYVPMKLRFQGWISKFGKTSPIALEGFPDRTESLRISHAGDVAIIRQRIKNDRVFEIAISDTNNHGSLTKLWPDVFGKYGEGTITVK